MKKILYKIGLSLMISTVLLTSCEEYINEAEYIDPTQPTDASIGLMFAGSEMFLAGFHEGDLARIGGMWSQHFSGEDRQYISIDNYTTTSGDFDAGWNNVYAGYVKTMRQIQKKAIAINDSATEASAIIREALVMTNIVALWGDVPYKEAGNFDVFPNPKYEKAADILADLLIRVETSIDRLSTNNRELAIAHEVKARILMLQGDYTSAVAEFDLGVTSIDKELVATHGTTYGGSFNVYYSFLVYDRAGYMGGNGFAAKLLDPAEANPIRNNPDGKTDESLRYAYSFHTSGYYGAGYECNYFSAADWGAPDGYFGTTTSWGILTYRGNRLSKAECQMRLENFDGALATLNEFRAYMATGGYLNQAWETTFKYDPYVAADFDPNGLVNPDGLTRDQALFKEIVTEKYLSSLGMLEAYNLVRSKAAAGFTGQVWQVLGITPKNGATSIPQRFLYPQDEINSNSSTPADPGINSTIDLPYFQ